MAQLLRKDIANSLKQIEFHGNITPADDTVSPHMLELAQGSEYKNISNQPKIQAQILTSFEGAIRNPIEKVSNRFNLSTTHEEGSTKLQLSIPTDIKAEELPVLKDVVRLARQLKSAFDSTLTSTHKQSEGLIDSGDFGVKLNSTGTSFTIQKAKDITPNSEVKLGIIAEPTFGGGINPRSYNDYSPVR